MGGCCARISSTATGGIPHVLTPGLAPPPSCKFTALSMASTIQFVAKWNEKQRKTINKKYYDYGRAAAGRLQRFSSSRRGWANINLKNFKTSELDRVRPSGRQLLKSRARVQKELECWSSAPAREPPRPVPAVGERLEVGPGVPTAGGTGEPASSPWNLRTPE